MTQTTTSRLLPEDLIIEILSRLSVKTLLRFKSASKSLFNLIISPEFVKLYLRRSPVVQNSSKILLRSYKFLACFDVDPPQRRLVQLDIHPDVIKLLEPYFDDNLIEYFRPGIVAICNGVVCFKKQKEIVLYNPATRAYRQVPRPPFHTKINDELIAYDCVGDDFKIFSIIKYSGKRGDSDECETYLYNLKGNSWSKIKSPPRGFHSFPSGCRIANDALYWMIYEGGLVNLRIVRFDVSSHRYEEISLPISVLGLWKIRLGVLNGRLHLMDEEFGLDIWMLKEDKCWSRVFHSSDSEYMDFLSSHSMTDYSLEPYAYSKDGRKIIIGDLRVYKKVICCDLESQTLSVVQVLGLPEGVNFTVIPWTESLVPLA
ncbi:F-box protein At4g22390-like [Silene latifolia]|uniref:F-box protein At4g22390-like n=1 Tax=Silene latifolia TaxID=37657 RepID=UPI003D776E48